MLRVRGASYSLRIAVCESHHSRFLDKESYPKSESGRGDLLHDFNVPDFLYNKTCTELNGYFGCRGIYSKERKLESYSTLSFRTFASLYVY
jgi:hypothetical protein